MTAPTRPAQPAAKKQPIPTRPYRAGVQPVDEQPYDITTTITASSTPLTPQYEIPSTGFLNDVYILVECTVTGNTATANVTFTEDGPECILTNLTFTDTNNQPIVGPLNGKDLEFIDKWGGYRFQDDPRAIGSVFTTTTGTATGAGSFTFVLRIPVELVPREGLGTLPNKSASTPFKVKCSINTLSSIYTSNPSTVPSIRVRMAPVSYWQPQAADLNGNPLAQQPPAVDTTQFWNVTEYTVTAGQQNLQLSSSVGFPIRNLGFVLKDTTNTTGGRADGETDWPDPVKVQLEANIIVDRVKTLWKQYLAEDYGYTAAVGATLGKDSGLYWLTYCRDFAQKPGWETRRGYLPTTDAMKLKWMGSVGATGGSNQLIVYTNYVAVAKGNTLASITA